MTGRAKSPLLKLQMGTAKPDRLNYAEPLVAANIDAPPDWFTPGQRAKWLELIAAAPHGLLKQLDRALVIAFVCSADRYELAARRLARQRDPFGKKAIACIAIQNAEARIMKALASELGFSPAARPRIQVSPAPGERSEFEKLMG